MGSNGTEPGPRERYNQTVRDVEREVDRWARSVLRLELRHLDRSLLSGIPGDDREPEALVQARDKLARARARLALAQNRMVLPNTGSGGLDPEGPEEAAPEGPADAEREAAVRLVAEVLKRARPELPRDPVVDEAEVAAEHAAQRAPRRSRR